MTTTTILAATPERRPFSDPNLRELEVIPVRDVRQLGSVGRYTFAAYGQGEVKIHERVYFPDSATRADVLVVEELSTDSGTSYRYVGGGRAPSSPDRQVLHEAWLVDAGSYRAELEAATRRRNPAAPPVLPVRVGPHVDQVRAQLTRQGITFHVHAGRLLLSAQRGRILDDTLELARKYRELLTERRTSCARCKAIAEYVAEIDVPLCQAHAEQAES